VLRPLDVPVVRGVVLLLSKFILCNNLNKIKSAEKKQSPRRGSRENDEKAREEYESRIEKSRTRIKSSKDIFPGNDASRDHMTFLKDNSTIVITCH
jgi:hypothetical protein